MRTQQQQLRVRVLVVASSLLGLFLQQAESFLTGSKVTSSSTVHVHQDASKSISRLFMASSFDPSALLYAEQEKMLVRRGALEADLMANTYEPLEANVVKGSGGGGGFGGGGGGGSKKTLLKTQAKSHAKLLKSQGVVRIDNVLSNDLADSLRKEVYQLREESEQLVASGRLPSLARFADVLLKENRCDLTLPMGPAWVADALDSLLTKSAIGATISNILGPDAILYELSCLMSDPGSNRQVAHPDTPFRDEPVLLTCFVALQDITVDMGPTTWIPQTHTQEMHEIFQDESSPSGGKDELLSTKPSVLGLLPKGSCAIFDSRLLHCGGANISLDKSRALLYLTFQNPNVRNAGNPGSIRKDLIGQWTLQDLEQELALYAKGKPTDRLIR